MKVSIKHINEEVMNRMRKKAHFENYTNKDGMVAFKFIDKMLKDSVRSRKIIDFGLFRVMPMYNTLRQVFINRRRFS